MSKIFYDLCKSLLALLLPPLAKAFQYISNVFSDPYKSPLMPLMQKSTIPPLPPNVKALQYISDIFHAPCESLAALLRRTLQNPFDICLKSFSTPAKVH